MILDKYGSGYSSSFRLTQTPTQRGFASYLMPVSLLSFRREIDANAAWALHQSGELVRDLHSSVVKKFKIRDKPIRTRTRTGP